MKKLLLAFSGLLVAITTIHAQGHERPMEVSANASQVYFELGGPGIIYSFNYDGRLSGYENGIGFRIGLGGASVNGEGYLLFPSN